MSSFAPELIFSSVAFAAERSLLLDHPDSHERMIVFVRFHLKRRKNENLTFTHSSSSSSSSSIYFLFFIFWRQEGGG